MTSKPAAIQILHHRGIWKVFGDTVAAPVFSQLEEAIVYAGERSRALDCKVIVRDITGAHIVNFRPRDVSQPVSQCI